MTAIIRRSPIGALTVVEPFYRPMRLFEEVERIARNFRPSLAPSVDIVEDKDELVVKAELPGIKKEDLDISVEGDELTIKAEKKQEEVAESATYYRCERCFGEYYRSISLPFRVDTEKVSATLENGVLMIRLPKAEEAKSKHIEVKIQSPGLRKSKAVLKSK